VGGRETIDQADDKVSTERLRGTVGFVEQIVSCALPSAADFEDKVRRRTKVERT
jgi:hypothetical protein